MAIGREADEEYIPELIKKSRVYVNYTMPVAMAAGYYRRYTGYIHMYIHE